MRMAKATSRPRTTLNTLKKWVSCLLTFGGLGQMAWNQRGIIARKVAARGLGTGTVPLFQDPIDMRKTVKTLLLLLGLAAMSPAFAQKAASAAAAKARFALFDTYCAE